MKKAPNESRRKTAESARKQGTCRTSRRLALSLSRKEKCQIVPNRAELCRNVLPAFSIMVRKGENNKYSSI